MCKVDDPYEGYETRKVILFEPVEDRFDLDDLKRWGRIVTLFPNHRVPSFFKKEGEEFVTAMYAKLYLIEYDHKKDHLVALGKSLHILFAALHLLNEYGQINLLVFDARYETYADFTIRREDARFISGDDVPLREINIKMPADQGGREDSLA